MKKVVRVYKNLLLFILQIFVVVFILNSCKSVEDCVENQILGNIGSVINSNLDEHSPSILILPDSIKQKYPNTDTNDYLFFTATQEDINANEAIFDVLLNDFQSGAELIDDATFPLNDTTKFRHAGMPVYYYNNTANRLELYFAALPKFGRLSRDIFFAQKDLETNEWSNSVSLPINTQHWESHPTISQDGKMLMFSSDRPNSVGDIDIWVSFRDEEGNWGEAINLGEEINTATIDYTPVFTENNDILFASNGKGERRTDFDIFLAKFNETENNWVEPQMFGFPINTEFDEMGATISKNRIYLSSDRRGGCGGKDIYSFQLCGPVLLAGQVNCANPEQILEGEMFLIDKNTKDTIASSEVEKNGRFNLGNLEPNINYILDYKNKCYPHKKNVYDFRSPCSDSSTVMVVVNMVMPEKFMELELTEVEIPYFVTGYYKPNTEENLNALRLSFSYNLYGNNTKTKYIENPGENYNQFVTQVEAGLDDVVKYIANMVSTLNNQCVEAENRGTLQINVQGWADPRNISTGAEYSDENINDANFNFQVRKGTKMDNALLSKLRAYFTAKYFEGKLINEYEIGELANSIKWSIEGMGVDAAENVEDELKRKVKISLQYLE
jgi:hypothetical protein